MDRNTRHARWCERLLLVVLVLQGITPDSSSLASSALVHLAIPIVADLGRPPAPLVEASWGWLADAEAPPAHDRGFESVVGARISSSTDVCVPPRQELLPLRDRPHRGHPLPRLLAGHLDPAHLRLTAAPRRARLGEAATGIDDPIHVLCRLTC